MNDFTTTLQVKCKAFNVLSLLISLGEGKIAKHFETILKTLVRYFYHDEPEIVEKVKMAARKIPLAIPFDISFPILVSLLEKSDQNSIKTVSAFLWILSMLIEGGDLGENLPKIMEKLEFADETLGF